MGAGHAHPLYRHGHSPIHRLPPQVKIVAAFGTVIAVVATPREAFWAFGVYAALLAIVVALARIPPGWLAGRVLIEAPFVLLAVALPLLEGGRQVEWFGLSLSVSGLYGAWNILIKGTLGVITSLTLAATTSGRELLFGLERLRMPSLLVQIATFMIRYIDVIAGHAKQMRIARMSRCHDPRFLWQAKAFAMSVGTLFLRSFERGERVYVAMLSRGYTGTLPVIDDRPVAAAQWAAALALPVAAAAVTVTAWLLR